MLHLSERFHVSVRTIQRDLDRLQQMGFPLYTEVGVNGGYHVLPNRILPPLQLTLHEAFGLFMMLQYLENVHDFPYGSVRAHLAEHYFSSLPPDVQETINRMRKHASFLHRKQTQSAPLTTKLLEAAADKKEIGFLYQSRSGTKQAQVYPLGIYYENGFWYMPAMNQQRVIYKLFSRHVKN
jgi:predicted DNA-binding transcriptional regulator YafY